MAKINGIEDKGIEIIFPRVIKLREAKNLCYHLVENYDRECFLVLNEGNETSKQTEESDKQKSLIDFYGSRRTLSGEIIRADDSANIELDFNLGPQEEFNKSLYDRIKIKIGKYNDDTYVKENHNSLSVFVDDMMHSIEEYSNRYFMTGKAR
ncbi:MAG: hypothetical protein WC867_08655 [Candidatus Pacearchaeota archaeon]|jgi:hypothetical protein